MKRIIATVIVAICAVIVTSLIAGWALSRPVRRAIGPPPPELGAEPVTFSSESGSLLHAWWCPVSNGGAAVLLLPGVRANRLSMVERAKFLHRSGYSVLLIDFQATGESPGREITFGWRESRDVLASLRFLGRQPSIKRVAIVGSSLGGAAALLATPPSRVHALVLEAVYPTVDRAVGNRLRNYLGPLGCLVTPLLLLQLPIRLGISERDLRPIDHIASIECPVFVINGANDRRTTVEDAVLLYTQARSPKQLWLVPDAGHVDLHRVATSEYESRVLSFLASSLRGPGL